MILGTKAIWDKYFRQAPMRYYDAGANITNEKIEAMLQNKDNNYIATLKSDGEWCRIIVGDREVVAQSRNISKVTGEYGDKTELIPHIIEEVKSFPAGTVLLGELCFSNITTTARDVGSILRCKAPKAIERQKNNKLIYRVFDCLAYAGEDFAEYGYECRFEVARDKIELEGFKYIQMCKYVTENFEDFLADILAMGGEGIVIHSKDYIYAPGQRPAWKTLKIKKTTGEIECPVVNTIEPNKLYEGKELENWEFFIDGVAVTKPYYYEWKNGIIINHNGNKVRVTSGLTDDDREWLTSEEAEAAIKENRLYAVVSGMEISSTSIRHPRLIRLRMDV